ncbi:Bug family tripartite tricarboxylate transporter substrate binding protein [Variovorax beijingensis]|uniref:Bug family tripartite tricarboxylate transporter substrate binding protein n=1 Tax=Variovorax beijingensis TaxID=2496117 RepID=UPI003F6A5225
MPRLITCLVTSLAGVALAAAAHAQAYPDRPVRFIVPFAAGGTTDVIARVVANEVSRHLGQPVVVENKAGAGGNIGTNAVAKAAPDGYTVGVIGNSFTVNPSLYGSMPYKQSDLAPVAVLAEVPFVLETGPNSSIKDLPGLLAQAKASAGKLTYASGGAGTIGHLGMHWFTDMAKVSMLHVPYRGAAPAVTDVMGGQVEVFLDTLTGATPLIATEKVRALMVTSSTRIPGAPGVPTATELGFPDFTISAWVGLVAPAGTPQRVLEQINSAVNQSLQSEAVRKALASIGAQPRPGTRAAAAEFMKSEEKRWGAVVRASGAKVD